MTKSHQITAKRPLCISDTYVIKSYVIWIFTFFIRNLDELINDKMLSCVIPRNQSGVSAGSHSQTSTVITSESGSQCLSSQKAFAELEGNFKIITRGIVSLATGLSHNKEVKDFFVHLVEKVHFD